MNHAFTLIHLIRLLRIGFCKCSSIHKQLYSELFAYQSKLELNEDNMHL